MSAEPARLRLALCGDVMLGRGIDQILPHPGNPAIYVSQNGITDANVYVRAAEQRHGAIPAARGFDYVWGDALSLFSRFAPDLRLINLETAITTQGKPWPNKWIHYRMNPRNVATLVHGGVDFCSLANNHLIDWGYVGLAETMNTLATVGIARRRGPQSSTCVVTGDPARTGKGAGDCRLVRDAIRPHAFAMGRRCREAGCQSHRGERSWLGRGEAVRCRHQAARRCAGRVRSCREQFRSRD